MTEEARLEQSEHGAHAASAGWFVLNLADARWMQIEGSGHWTDFEPPDGFEHYGIGVHVLPPGEPNGKYHSENVQEDFLVLSGECIAIVNGEERPMRQWDFLHCPASTEHVFVGAGDGPCAVLMIGSRREDAAHYPVNEVAAKYSASAKQATDSPPEAYAEWRAEPWEIVPAPWPPG